MSLVLSRPLTSLPLLQVGLHPLFWGDCSTGFQNVSGDAFRKKKKKPLCPSYGSNHGCSHSKYNCTDREKLCYIQTPAVLSLCELTCSRQLPCLNDTAQPLPLTAPPPPVWWFTGKGRGGAPVGFSHINPNTHVRANTHTAMWGGAKPGCEFTGGCECVCRLTPAGYVATGLPAADWPWGLSNSKLSLKGL